MQVEQATRVRSGVRCLVVLWFTKSKADDRSWSTLDIAYLQFGLLFAYSLLQIMIASARFPFGLIEGLNIDSWWLTELRIRFKDL